MPIEVTIGNMTFPSKKAAIEFFSKILNGGECDSEIIGDDARFVDELFRQRPDKVRELGDRAVIRYLRSRHRHNTPCFVAELSDGSQLDFSFYKLIKAYPIPTGPSSCTAAA